MQLKQTTTARSTQGVFAGRARIGFFCGSQLQWPRTPPQPKPAPPQPKPEVSSTRAVGVASHQYYKHVQAQIVLWLQLCIWVSLQHKEETWGNYIYKWKRKNIDAAIHIIRSRPKPALSQPTTIEWKSESSVQKIPNLGSKACLANQSDDPSCARLCQALHPSRRSACEICCQNGCWWVLKKSLQFGKDMEVSGLPRQLWWSPICFLEQISASNNLARNGIHGFKLPLP